MDDKTLQALTTLAAKLGTTAEYLWGVLLKQAPITGVIDLLVLAAWIAAAVVWARFVQRKTKTPDKTDDDRYPNAEWESEGAFLAWVSVFLLGLIAAFVVGSELSTTASALLNPEYWALKQILH